MTDIAPKSTATSMGTDTGGALMIYVFKCWTAHKIIVPDETVAIILAGTIAPIVEMLGRIVVALIEKFTGADINQNGVVGNGAH